MVHLAYCDDKEKVMEKINKGSKTMIIRGAAGRKIPHSRVFKDEILYLMKKGSAQITAKAKIVNVQNYVKLLVLKEIHYSIILKELRFVNFIKTNLKFFRLYSAKN